MNNNIGTIQVSSNITYLAFSVSFLIRLSVAPSVYQSICVDKQSPLDSAPMLVSTMDSIWDTEDLLLSSLAEPRLLDWSLVDFVLEIWSDISVNDMSEFCIY